MQKFFSLFFPSLSPISAKRLLACQLSLHAKTAVTILGCTLSLAGFAKNAIAQAAELGKVSWGYQRPMDRFFSEGIASGDINGDGSVDLVVGPYWLEGPDFDVRHQVQAGDPVDPHGYAPHFFSFTDDLNHDGNLDILHIGFPGQAAYWLENPGDHKSESGSQIWARHEVIDIVDNESPTYVDLTGDGVREILCSRQGSFGYATPKPDDPNALWNFHAISPNTVAGGRFTHGLGYGDINGDGRTDILEKNGWWEQPETLADDPNWKFHAFPFSGPGGSQMFAADFDGDGDADVVTALAAHGYGVAWYEQVLDGDKISFKQHLIAGSKPSETSSGLVFSQPHAVTIADIDGDFLLDIVTGKRPWAHGPHGDPEPLAAPVLYWFQCQRNADGTTDFIPRLISDDSGVGVDVLVTDINQDGLPDVVSANKRGVFVHRQSRTPADQLVAAKLDITAPAKLLPSAKWPTEGLEPLAAAKQFTAPEGFHVDLVAGEPDLHQPVAFCFDGAGRIWVAEAHTYPRRAPEGEGKDVIRVFEDKDGDGKFETKKTFIEGLNLVSGIEVGFGGVYVGAAPYLLFIPDRDQDGIADSKPEILLDGFGYQDTHETLNTFTWGPDGWLYGCHGVFTHSNVGAPGTPDDQRTKINAGVFRFHPVTRKFEVFAAGTSNPWGLAFDQRGQAFVTACVIPHAYHMVHGGRFQRQAGQHFNPYTFDDIKTIADHAHYAGNIADHAWWGRNEAVEDDATSLAGGGHAHCGALMYYGDNWPVNYRGNLLMHNIHGNRVNVDLLRQDGTGYIASHGRDLVFANDPWFRGIGMQLGPDGALYLIDWYDANACHRNSPEIWDRTNGRMYRVRFGDQQARKIDVAHASIEQLVDYLSHENEFHVRAARMELMQRSAEGQSLGGVRTKLLGMVNASNISSEQRLDYLWAAHAIAPINPSEAKQLFSSSDSDVRAWTIQLVCEQGTPPQELITSLLELAKNDRSPVVSLYLASALIRLSGDEESLAARWQIAESLTVNGDSQFDKNLPLMIWYAVEPLVPQQPDRAMQLAANCQIPLVRQFIYRRAATDPELVNSLVAAMAKQPNDQIAIQMIHELAGASAKLGKIAMPKSWPDVVTRASKFEDANVRREIQALSVSFGDKSIFPILRETVRDANAELGLRQEALAALARGADPQLEDLAKALFAENQLRTDVLPLLARFDSTDIPQLILTNYDSMDATMKRTALDALSSRKSHAEALLDAMESEKVPRTDVSAVHAGKIRQLGDNDLSKRLTELWGQVGATPEDIAKEIAELKKFYTGKRLASANANHGRQIYQQTCGQCHKLFGEGGDIGPDLTGANRGNIDYLLENILAPNAIVGKDYQAVTVLTLDGRVVTGLVREQSDAAIVLHDAEKLVTIPQSEIDSISETVRSVMPEGILKPFNEEQIGDLLAYLQSTSQVLPLAAVPEFDSSTGKIPAAIEGESLQGVKTTAGTAAGQGMGGFKEGRWSGNNQLWWTGGKPNAKLTLPFSMDEGGNYSVAAAFTKARDYAVIKVELDGETLIEGLDLFEDGRVVNTGPLVLGEKVLKAGNHTLEITILGCNPKAVPAYMVGVDYLYLAPSQSTGQIESH